MANLTLKAWLETIARQLKRNKRSTNFTKIKPSEFVEKIKNTVGENVQTVGATEITKLLTEGQVIVTGDTYVTGDIEVNVPFETRTSVTPGVNNIILSKDHYIQNNITVYGVNLSELDPAHIEYGHNIKIKTNSGSIIGSVTGTGPKRFNVKDLSNVTKTYSWLPDLDGMIIINENTFNISFVGNSSGNDNWVTIPTNTTLYTISADDITIPRTLGKFNGLLEVEYKISSTTKSSIRVWIDQDSNGNIFIYSKDSLTRPSGYVSNSKFELSTTWFNN